MVAAVRGRADAVGARSSLPLVRRIVAKPSHGKRLTRHSGQQDLEQHKAGVSKPTRKAKLAHLRVGVDLKPAVPPAVTTQTSDAYNPRTGLWECPRGCGYTCAKRQGLGGHNHKGRCPLFPTSRGRCEATGGQSAIRRAPSPAASETAEATSTSDTNSPTCRDDERHVVRQHGRRELGEEGEEGEDGEREDAAHDARRASGRPRAQIARYIAEPAPDPHALRMAVLAAKEREAREREGMGHDGHHGIGMSSGKASMLTHALTSVDARAAVRAEHGASSAQPSLPSEVRGALLEENARRRNGKGGACHGPLRVEEYGLDDAGFGEAKAEAGWELIDGWYDIHCHASHCHSHASHSHAQPRSATHCHALPRIALPRKPRIAQPRTAAHRSATHTTPRPRHGPRRSPNSNPDPSPNPLPDPNHATALIEAVCGPVRVWPRGAGPTLGPTASSSVGGTCVGYTSSRPRSYSCGQQTASWSDVRRSTLTRRSTLSLSP
jgi:hypothetical protein